MTKLTIVSGFLGAGKTTLLRQLVARSTLRAECCVVIENEFGSIGFDAAQFSSTGVRVYEINQGCVCCSLQATFAETLERVLADPSPDRVFFEPSGIFIPDRLLDVLQAPAFHQRYGIASFITVIDAQRFQTSRRSFGSFFQRQAEFADVFAIGQTDSLDTLAIEELRSTLRRINPSAQQTMVAREHTPATVLDGLMDSNIVSVAKGATALAGLREPGAADGSFRADHHSLESLTCELPPAIRLSELEGILEELASGRFGKIVRAKGTLESDFGTADFSLVAETIEVSPLSFGRTDSESLPLPCGGKIVVIGEALDRAGIAARLAQQLLLESMDANRQ